MTQLSNDTPRPAGQTPAWTVTLSWVVIAAITTFLFAANNWPGTRAAPTKGMLDAQAELPGKLLVGAAAWAPQWGPMLLPYAQQLRRGSVREKLAFAVLAGELISPERAVQELDAIDTEVEASADTGTAVDEAETGERGELDSFEGSVDADDSAAPAQARDALMRIMQARQGEHAEGIDLTAELEPQEIDALHRELGWYAELALLPPESADQAARYALLKAASRLLLILCGYGLWFLGAILAGLVVLIVLLVQACTQGIRSRLSMHASRQVYYAEMVAIWLLLFLALQIVVDLLQPPENWRLGISGLLTLSSLIVLAWPVLRGATWRDVTRDLGLHGGRGVVLELSCGLLVYCMAIAMLVVGLVISLCLMALQQKLRPGEPGPSHPAVDALAGGGTWAMVQVMILAAFIAPLVEEIMFRGSLYGHLRTWAGGFGAALAIALSAFVSSLIFAAIHPQGWTLIPALMGLAVGFCIGREWRGCLLPGMVAHGLHNLLTVLIGSLVFS